MTRRPILWLSAVALAGLIVGVLSASVAPGAGTSAAADAGGVDPGPTIPRQTHLAPPAPARLVRGGVTYVAEQTGIQGIRRHPGRGDLLDVYVFDHAGSRPDCDEIAGQVRVLREQPDRVVLAAFGYRPGGKQRSGQVGCMYVSIGESGLYRKRTVRLAAPLGDRIIYDAFAGDAVGLITRDPPPRPGYLPPGYRATDTRAPSAITSFIGTRQYRRGELAIEIRTQPGHSARRGSVVARDRVGDDAAVVTDESYERCVRWSPEIGHIREVCSLAPHHHYLPVAELLRIARSL